ncbi:hypothetical protein BDK51DRAFT_38736 [Blyttiomyces helicus]|uniref:Uncharacterized protein n=1 Tax=Blyttiomyces helicus TaxID=388810 RepID=A0A4V1IR97_9FUNG|nr:hypothetical protein BDK51DRAFT_38736 [Blyttiomyces helicus]|eukprot:RKO89297.1 hypothetical protein BDK51DRAFT_38736 [Blyttiomyces helicus]
MSSPGTGAAVNFREAAFSQSFYYPLSSSEHKRAKQGGWEPNGSISEDLGEMLPVLTCPGCLVFPEIVALAQRRFPWTDAPRGAHQTLRHNAPKPRSTLWDESGEELNSNVLDERGKTLAECTKAAVIDISRHRDFFQESDGRRPGPQEKRSPGGVINKTKIAASLGMENGPAGLVVLAQPAPLTPIPPTNDLTQCETQVRRGSGPSPLLSSPQRRPSPCAERPLPAKASGVPFSPRLPPPSMSARRSGARGVIEHTISAPTAVKHDRGELDPRLHLALHLLSRWLEMAEDNQRENYAVGVRVRDGRWERFLRGEEAEGDELEDGDPLRGGDDGEQEMTLLAAAAVCQGWAAPARAVLLQTVELDTNERIGKLVLAATMRKHRLGAKDYAASPPTRGLTICRTRVETFIKRALVLPLFRNVRALDILTLADCEQNVIRMGSLATLLTVFPRLKSDADWAGVSSVMGALEAVDVRPQIFDIAASGALSRMFAAVGPRLQTWILSGTVDLSDVPIAACPNLEILELAESISATSFGIFTRLNQRMYPPIPNSTFCENLGRIPPSIPTLRSLVSMQNDRALCTLLELPSVQTLEITSADLHTTEAGPISILGALHAHQPLTTLRLVCS